MDKKARLKKVKELLLAGNMASQEQIKVALEKDGVHVNQATLSRDLRELSVVKAEGVYQISTLTRANSSFVTKVDFKAAGQNLLVARVSPGQAMSLAAMIDELALKEVIGTIAGDDTIMIATQNQAAQKRIASAIMARL